MSESLADEFARMFSETSTAGYLEVVSWCDCNYDRILAALRVAEIVNDPTPAEQERIGDCVAHISSRKAVGRSACAAINSLKRPDPAAQREVDRQPRAASEELCQHFDCREERDRGHRAVNICSHLRESREKRSPNEAGERERQG